MTVGNPSGAVKIRRHAARAIIAIVLGLRTDVTGRATLPACPDGSTANRHNEVFGHPGLYVCDGSMIPAHLGVNPSLTITALAEHARSHVPVKEGATPRLAMDPAHQARCVAEVEARTARGNASLQVVQRRMPSSTSEISDA
ncbi:MAG: GMC oxidoreductase [Deltaproteobacteria bacterium]